MSDADRQILGGIILTLLFGFLWYSSKFGVAMLGILALIGILGLILISSGLNDIPADGILVDISDGEYTFINFYTEERNNNNGEYLPKNKRSKVVQMWPRGKENVLSSSISWRVREASDPDGRLNDEGLTPGLVLRIKDNAIAKIVIYTAYD